MLEKKTDMKERIAKANEKLTMYRNQNATEHERIVECDRFWKRTQRLLEDTNGTSKNKSKTKSAWLFNSIANKHADMMDNYPEPNILPREEGDKETASVLSKVLPVVLEQNNFEDAFSRAGWDKIVTGYSIYGVFWNPLKLNGLGDVEIKVIDPLKLYFDTCVEDIQQSQNVFYAEEVENEIILEAYPQLEGRLNTTKGDVSNKAYDETSKTQEQEKSAIVDWYYKKVTNGKTLLHYCKYIGDEVVYSSEDEEKKNKREIEKRNKEKQAQYETILSIAIESKQDTSMMETPDLEEYVEKGFYHDGKYPFVIDVLYPHRGKNIGFGYVDIMKDPQERVDKINDAITDNAFKRGKQRWFLSNSLGANPIELADWDKEFVKIESGADLQSKLVPLTIPPVGSDVVAARDAFIEELKETSGNRDFSQGGTTSGVTAASAIAALQEAGSKLSRNMIKDTYRSCKLIFDMVIERIRQFYDLPRQFRIMGNGEMSFQFVDNSDLQGKPIEVAGIGEIGQSEPIFDIDIKPQKSNPYTKMAQNELALEFMGRGFFNPQMADQAAMCLDMMNFDGKEELLLKIKQSGLLFDRCMQLLEMLASINPMLALQAAQMLQMQPPPQAIQGANMMQRNIETNSLGGVQSADARANNIRSAVSAFSDPNGGM